MARQSFIVAVVPLADVLCDFDLRVGGTVRFTCGAMLVPGERTVSRDTEKLEGALCATARGDVDVSGRGEY